MEADYEKLERRSRIRTARARQINPQVIEGQYRILGGTKPQFLRQTHQREAVGLRVVPLTDFQDQAPSPQ